MQCCSVSYSVTLVQIQQELRKLQPVQYILHGKIARDSFIMKLLRIFFSFCAQYIFLIITTAAWILKIIIKLISDYVVFKFDGSI